MEPMMELKAIINDGLKNLDNDHLRLLQIIDSRYAEENKGQLLVATGAFVLLINFLINQHNPEWISLLLIGVTLLLLNIILKFHILRLSAERTSDELQIVKDKIRVSGVLYSLIIKLELHNDNQTIIEIESEYKKLVALDKRLEKLPYKWTNTNVLNELEYYLFSISLGIILIFFFLNIVD